MNGALQGVELSAIKNSETYDAQMDKVADLEVQLQQLALKEFEIEKRLGESGLQDKSRRQEIERTIARLESQIRSQGRIVSEHRGRVLEITTSAGSVIQAGERMGSLEVDNPESKLGALAYFPLQDGKKIRAAMKARISPATVRRERFGSMLGAVETVSDYPVTTAAVANQIGNKELAAGLARGGNRIEVLVALEPDGATSSGYAWTSSSGPDLAITAGTTASVRVTIEERAPITLLIPLLRSWFGQE